MFGVTEPVNIVVPVVAPVEAATDIKYENSEYVQLITGEEIVPVAEMRKVFTIPLNTVLGIKS